MNKSGYDYLLYFGSPSCVQCRALKESLKKANVVYEESEEYDKRTWCPEGLPDKMDTDSDIS